MTMKTLILTLFAIFIVLQSQRVVSEEENVRASLPPRGWNSYDSYSWTISEQDLLQIAEIMKQRLKCHGYEYVVVDFQWYRKKIGDKSDSDAFGFDNIDEWGRVIPDPDRWPSSKCGKGFADVSQILHDMGLKFGVHVMRGISTRAVDANTPIFDINTGRAYEECGRKWYAKDIAIPDKLCSWMPEFMSVNTSLGAGRAFLSSLYHQYADWGLDFVKHDCVFGSDYSLDEITTVSEVLRGLNRSIIYSISPGFGVTPTMAKSVAGLVNMYRITGDDWDKWDDVAAHFDVTGDLSNMTGADGLLGKSWPDSDMLPLGWLTDPGVNEGPHRMSNLTLDEQKTQMTLWSIAKSPLMFGGDVRKIDDTTFNIITNPVLLEINSYSTNNKEFHYITSTNVSRQLQNAGDMDTHFGADVCTNPGMKGWVIESQDNDIEKVCWKSTKNKAFCIYMKKPVSPVGEEKTYSQKNEGKVNLLLDTKLDICLHTTRQFYPCKPGPNQLWEFNNDGTLKNEYSGLCLSVEDNVEFRRVRSWIATGRKGEVYLAFFNLEAEKTIISAKLADLAKNFDGINLESGSCTYSEVWSGKDLGQVGDQISAEVESHGTVLFVLNCSKC